MGKGLAVKCNFNNSINTQRFSNASCREVSECLAEEPCEGKPHAGFCEGSSIISTRYYGCSTR